MSEPVRPALSIIVPAYDEESGVAASLESLRAELPGAEILVVDDGSRDQTAARAAAVAGVQVLRHRFNRGYGASLKTGMSHAQGALIAWFDADNEHRAADLEAMVDLIENDRLAAVIGQRRSAGTSVMRISGKWLMRMVARSLKIDAGRDLNCGLRVFRREAILPYLSLLPDGFSASVTSTMMVFEKGFPIAFHPIDTQQRIGTSKVHMRDGFRAVMTIFRTVMLFAPMRIFLRFGFLLMTIGGLYSVYEALAEGTGVPTAGVLVILTGLLLSILGLIADQISQIRLGAISGLASGLPTSDSETQDNDLGGDDD